MKDNNIQCTLSSENNKILNTYLQELMNNYVITSWNLQSFHDTLETEAEAKQYAQLTLTLRTDFHTTSIDVHKIIYTNINKYYFRALLEDTAHVYIQEIVNLIKTYKQDPLYKVINLLPNKEALSDRDYELANYVEHCNKIGKKYYMLKDIPWTNLSMPDIPTSVACYSFLGRLLHYLIFEKIR